MREGWGDRKLEDESQGKNKRDTQLKTKRSQKGEGGCLLAVLGDHIF